MESEGFYQTDNYLWKKSNRLGKGATSIVYEGIHKKTGLRVAIRCWKLKHQGDAEENLMKDVELLRKLDHENIIKVIGIETEITTKNKVAVIELAEGGSLHTVLLDPENQYGINEEEFLLLLKHSTAGLKYLRTHNISHRDIKPDNILLCITDDGRHIYKLADFDTAKVISEDESFRSICGTPQYLCPYMYVDIMDKLKTESRKFSPMVDLWSMACTFYHAATGSVPFIAKDSQGMYKIHTTKPAGVIAAVQTQHGVEWKDDLPDTCLLSSGLREILVCLLKKLLTKETRLSFKEYFTEMDKIFSKTPIHIFDVQKCKEYTFYLDPNASLGGLQIQIRNKTCMKVEDQILIQKGVALCKLEKTSSVCNVVKDTSPADPVYLLSSCQVNFASTIEQVSHIQFEFPQFVANAGFTRDSSVAEHCTVESYVVARRVENLSRCFKCISNVPVTTRSMLKQEAQQLSELLQKNMERLNVYQYILKLKEKHALSVTQFVPLLGLNDHVDTSSAFIVIEQRKIGLISIGELLSDLQNEIKSLQESLKSETGNLNSWMALEEQKTQLITTSKEIAYNYVKTIRSLWKTLESAWKSGSGCSIEDLKILKTTVTRTCSKLLTLHIECCTILQNVLRDLLPLIRKFQQDLQTCKKLKVKMDGVFSEIKTFEVLLNDAEDKCERMFSTIISKAQSIKGLTFTGAHQVPELRNVSLLQGLQEVKESHQTMQTALDENTSLIEKCLQVSEELWQKPTNSLIEIPIVY